MGRELADWAREHADLLLGRFAAEVTLDAVGEIVGTQAVTVVHIEALFDELEARGVVVQDGLGAQVSGLLEQVLAAARRLRARGASVAPAAVAAESGLSEREVRVALLFVHVLER